MAKSGPVFGIYKHFYFTPPVEIALMERYITMADPGGCWGHVHSHTLALWRACTSETHFVHFIT